MVAKGEREKKRERDHLLKPGKTQGQRARKGEGTHSFIQHRLLHSGAARLTWISKPFSNFQGTLITVICDPLSHICTIGYEQLKMRPSVDYGVNPWIPMHSTDGFRNFFPQRQHCSGAFNSISLASFSPRWFWREKCILLFSTYVCWEIRRRIHFLSSFLCIGLKNFGNKIQISWKLCDFAALLLLW